MHESVREKERFRTKFAWVDFKESVGTGLQEVTESSWVERGKVVDAEREREEERDHHTAKKSRVCLSVRE